MTGGLVGREAEAGALREALDDPGCSAVFLRGPAGSGKTALARAALEWAEADGFLIGAGKFAQGEAQSLFAPIMSALSQIAAQAFERLSDPEPVAAALTEALGPSLTVLIQTGFRLGAAPAGSAEPGPMAGPLVGRREGVARIADASLRLVRWLAPFEAPVALFIDDWRRGGDETGSIVASLIGEIRTPPLTLVLAERNDAPPSPLALAPRSRVIDVGTLAPADRRILLETVLGEAGGAVFDWLGPACPGLPFDLLATAEALRDAGAVTPRGGGGWRIDPPAVAALGRRDLARGLASRLETLPPRARHLALGAALWGDAAPCIPLGVALGMNPAAFQAALAEVSALGVLVSSSCEVRFPHDRLREAVLETGAERIAGLAGGMAERLAVSPDASWEAVGRTALRLRRASGVEDADAVRWRSRFARGSLAARAASDMEAASGFAECAWRLRDPQAAVGDPEHRLVAREAVLAAADRRDPGEVRARLAVLLDLAGHDREAQGLDYELGIAALRLAGDPSAAWATAKEGLARFGLVLPRTVGTARLFAAVVLWRLARLMRAWRPRRTAEQPGGADAFTRVANAAAMLAYERSSRLAALLALEGWRRAGRQDRDAPFWMSTETFLLASLGDWAGAARLGELTAAAVAAPGFSGFAHASTLNRAVGWGCAWRTPAAELRARAGKVGALAIAEGDLVQAAGAIRNRVLWGWRTSPSLSALETDVRQARAEAERLGDADVAAGVGVIFDAITHLSGDGLAAAAKLECGAGRPAWVRDFSAGAAAVTLELASIHGEWAFARDFAAARRAFGRNLASSPRTIDWRFHENLARLRSGRPARRADISALRRAAKLNPVDHRAEVLILKAAALSRRRSSASGTAWAEAVDAAEAGSSRLIAGVAAECAAEASRLLGHAQLADRYAARAQATWRAWGALAKLDGPTAGRPDEPLAGVLAQAQAQAAVAELTARARARFLADVAHELRTPLQSLQGLLDLAVDDPAALDLASLRDVSASLRTLVDDLTDLGAMTSGETPISMRPVAIAELVRSECGLAAAFAAENGATLEVVVEDEVPAWVATDGPRVRQVVRNLISNAAKYSRGGRIRVSVVLADAGLRVTVDDEGPGFSESDRLRLFEPFERGARAGDGLGLGLGLALSRRIAARLGGALEAENRSGGGARFILRLPLTTVTPPANPEPPPKAAPLRILLAEDTALVRRLFAAILSRQGHHVSEAADGGQAAALLSERDFDLAILDLAMPVLDGLEVLARVAGAPNTPPAILLTASNDARIHERARAAGAALVLRKPVSAEELARAVADAVGGRVSPPFPPPSRPRDEPMESLRREARIELAARLRRFAEGPCDTHAARAAEAHRIAGLAAQFGWPDIAALADEIEAGCRGGRAPEALALEPLARAALALEGAEVDLAGLPPALPQASFVAPPS